MIGSSKMIPSASQKHGDMSEKACRKHKEFLLECSNISELMPRLRGSWVILLCMLTCLDVVYGWDSPCLFKSLLSIPVE